MGDFGRSRTSSLDFLCGKPCFYPKRALLADVFSQLYIHIIFTPKYREALIRPEWEIKLHKYITGIVQQRGHKLLAIGGMPDHIHLFIGLKPSESISSLVREIKKAGNVYIKENQLSRFPFFRQNGYGVFSHSHSNKGRVCDYILNQKEHHRVKTFRLPFVVLENQLK